MDQGSWSGETEQSIQISVFRAAKKQQCIRNDIKPGTSVFTSNDAQEWLLKFCMQVFLMS